MSNNDRQSGFTLTELIVVMFMIGVAMVMFGSFFVDTFHEYLGLQQDGVAFGNVAVQTQRVARIIRTSTEITDAKNNSLTLNSYFYPSDQYVSQVKYYVDVRDRLVADVTPYTQNPPIGTLQPDQTKTYLIVPSYYNPTGEPMFKYFDANGNQYATPDVELSMVKGVSIRLSSKGANSKPATATVRVSLRNAKTNL